MELKQTVEKKRVKPLSRDMMGYEARRDSVLFSGRLEGYAVDRNEAAAILASQVPLSDRQSVFLRGYGDALRWIFRENGLSLGAFTPLILHSFAYGGGAYEPEGIPAVSDPQVLFKRGIGAPRVTDGDMERLKELYRDFTDAMDQPETVPLIAIAAYLYSFNGICPFGADTGFVSRLLTTLLLHMHGFTVCRYVALEGYIEAGRGVYGDIAEMSKGDLDYEWLILWVDCFLGMVRSGYLEMRDRFRKATKKPPALPKALKVLWTEEMEKAFIPGAYAASCHDGQGY